MTKYTPADPHQLQLPGMTPPPNLLDLDPRRQLWIMQLQRCAACDRDIPADARAARNTTRDRIAALLCEDCIRFPHRIPTPSPGDMAKPLLRLRLTQGPALCFPLTVTDDDRTALADRDWNHFLTPGHALWVRQNGACALTGNRDHSRYSQRTLVLDYEAEAPRRLLGIVCLRCRATHGKNGHDKAWSRYQQQPPAFDLPATRGLTRHYLRASAQVGP